MRMNGVFRNEESLGNARLREIVKDALYNLQLALGQAQFGTDLKPGMVAEQRRSAQLALGIAPAGHGVRMRARSSGGKGECSVRHRFAHAFGA